MNSNARTKVVLALLILATIAFIMFNSCMDADASWQLSNATGGFFSPIMHGIHSVAVALFGWTGNAAITEYGAFVRKTAHFLEYAALGAECGALATVMSGNTLGNHLWMAAFIPLATAVTDEFVQGFVGRTSLVDDVVLDYTGALFGIAASILVAAIARQIKRKRSRRRR